MLQNTILEHMLKAIRAKAFDYILKPFCIDDIAGVVRRYPQGSHPAFQ
ncbi:MAG: hypothetical protein U5L09_19860 [Bacteroidales bacterium]|nr:hypothetical protein [Bacteroidales bacterium]